MPNPEGFWSYVHKDDQAEGGRIVRLLHDITDQYEMITGETINLFLDRDRLAWGDRWRDEIDRSLNTAAFFVAVLTPRYFMSVECRRELQIFARGAEGHGIGGLILPIHYVDVPGASDDTVQDEAVRFIKAFQWADWRELRFAEVSSSEYRRAVAGLAQRLADANRSIISSDLEGVPATERPPEPGTQTAGEETALLDLLATGESAMPRLAETTQEISAEMVKFTEFTNKAVEDLQRSDDAGRGFSGRLEVARTLALNIRQPATRILELANRYSAQMYDVDAGVRMLISLAPKEVEANPSHRKTICDFFAMVTTLAQTTRQASNQLQEMTESFTQTESLSRDLRPPLQTMRQGIALLIEATSVTDGWLKSIAESPIDCNGQPGSAA